MTAKGRINTLFFCLNAPHLITKNYSNMSKQKQPQKPIEATLLFDKLKLEKHSKSAIAVLTIALIFVLLVTSKGFLYPAVFVKTILFYGIIELIVALFVLLVFTNKRYWPHLVTIEAGKKKINWLLLLSGAYLIAATLSTFFAVNSYDSFFGSVGWSNGLLIILHFWALFVVLSSTFQDKNFWIWFLRINVFVGTWIALVALYQKFMQNTIAMGTFGNQGYLSAHLLFIIFISAVLFFQSKKKDEKIFWAILSLINFLTLFLTTDIRGSQLGFIVGIVFATTLYFLAHPKKKIRQITLGITLATLIFGIIFSVFLFSSGKIYQIFERSETVKTRITNWEIGWKGFLEKPLLGYGLENYYAVFEKYFNPQYYQQQSTEYAFGIPHNKFVEVAVSSGILGIASYLSLIFGIFWLLYKKFLQTRELEILALFGMWSAYFVHLFFLFDNIITFFMFFSLLAFTTFVLKENVSEIKDEKVKLKTFSAYGLLTTIVIVTGISIYYFSFQAARADYYAGNAINELLKKNYEKSISMIEKMDDVGIFYIRQKTLFELNREIEGMLLPGNKLNDLEKKYLEKLINENISSLAIDPSRIYYYLPISRTYFMAGKLDKTNYEKSNEMLQKMVASGTRRMEVYMYMAENYQALGQNDKAIEFGERAIAIDPTYGFADYSFARLYRLIGNDEKTFYYLDEAIKNGYTNAALYYFYADTANNKKDHDRAVVAFSQLIKLVPNEPQNYANLAMVYFEKKDYQKSREVSNQLIAKFPKFREQIQAFINKLPK